MKLAGLENPYEGSRRGYAWRRGARDALMGDPRHNEYKDQYYRYAYTKGYQQAMEKLSAFGLLEALKLEMEYLKCAIEEGGSLRQARRLFDVEKAIDAIDRVVVADR